MWKKVHFATGYTYVYVKTRISNVRDSKCPEHMFIKKKNIILFLEWCKKAYLFLLNHISPLPAMYILSNNLSWELFYNLTPLPKITMV